jgi:hypothetical protein
MKIEDIKEVEIEIQRFLKRLKEFKKSDFNKHIFYAGATDVLVQGDSTSGALKRASLDLTRSLSKLRNPIY